MFIDLAKINTARHGVVNVALDGHYKNLDPAPCPCRPLGPLCEAMRADQTCSTLEETGQGDRGCGPQVIENLREQSLNSTRLGNKKGACRSKVLSAQNRALSNGLQTKRLARGRALTMENGRGLERSFLTIPKHYNRVKSLRLFRSGGVYLQEALSRLLSHFVVSLSV